MFMGKNKVMSLALGRSPEEEHLDNLHYLTKHLSGSCGLLFTNEEEKTITSQMEAVDELHFARAGFVATEEFLLEKGAIPLPFSMETQLRKYGLPTILKDGKILLDRDVKVCKIGDVLTPEQCKLLEIFQFQMARFRIYPTCCWEKEGFQFKEYETPAWMAELVAAASSSAMDMEGFFD